MATKTEEVREALPSTRTYTLENEWVAKGENLEDFREILDTIASITEEISVDVKELEIGSYIGLSVNSKTQKPVYRMRILSEDLIQRFERTGEVEKNTAGNTATFSIREDNRALYQEEMEETHIHLVKDKEHYFLSRKAFTQLLDKAKLGGFAMLTPSLSRDVLVAKTLLDMKGNLKLIVRSLEGNDDRGNSLKINKVFGVLTQKYTRIEMQILYRAIDQLIKSCMLGKAEVASWLVTQDFAEVRVEFPEKADDYTAAYGLPQRLVPGIRLCSSDTGSSSVIIEPTYRISTSFAIGDERVKQIHSGKITEESILQDVQDQVLTKLQSFPEELAERLGIQVGNEDLTNSIGRRENKRLVLRCVRAGMKELKIFRILGKANKKLVLEKISSEIDDTLHYTEFDIALIIMGLAERIHTASRETKIQLAKACGRAASISYMDLVRSGKGDDEDIYIADPDEDL